MGMVDLFEKLNKEQVDIIDMFWSAFSFGIASAEGKANLMKAQSAFIDHIYREEKELCQILFKASETNAQIAMELPKISGDIMVLTRLIIDSLSEIMITYNSETQYYYKQIMYTILNRMSIEEEELRKRCTKIIMLLDNHTKLCATHPQST